MDITSISTGAGGALQRSSSPNVRPDNPFELIRVPQPGAGRSRGGGGGEEREVQAPADRRDALEQKLTALLERLTGVRIDPERLEKLLDRIDSLGDAQVKPAEPGEPAVDPVSPGEIRQTLIAFGRDIRDGIREIGRELVSELADDDPRLRRNLEFALKRIGDGFGSDLRRAFRASREGKSIDGEELLGRVQQAFDELQQKLERVFEAAQSPESFRGILGRLRNGDFGPTEPETPRTGNLVPLESAAGDDEGIGRLGFNGSLPTPSGDDGPTLDLSGLRERFEQLFARLSERFAPSEPLPTPVIPVYNEVAATSGDAGERLDLSS